jgi:hypothetical protein
VLDLPGGAGCSSVDGMAAYDERLWLPRTRPSRARGTRGVPR